MAVNGIEIQVGQVWRMRNGGVTRILGNDGHGVFPWDTEHESLTNEGLGSSIGIPFSTDLIELYSAPTPESLTFPKLDKYEDAAIHSKTDARFEKIDDHVVLTFHPLPEPGLTVNPKDAIGSTKLPLHLWPAEATALGCLGMLEGKEKYGRNNYIAGEGVVASIYVDAAKRHIDAWFSGEEVSPDTLNDHLGNALACLAIVVKTRAHGKLIDDRDFAPNAGYRKLVEELTPNVKRLQTLFADKKPRHFTIADSEVKS